MNSIKCPPLTKRSISRTLLLPMLLGLNACSYVINSATEDFSQRLTRTVLNHNDPKTVAEALPAYLLMQEASTSEESTDEQRLLSIADLYVAYLGLIADEERKQHLSQKALDFAMRGACAYNPTWCQLQQKSFDEAQTILQQTSADDLDNLYSIASAWAAWIQAHKSDWNAIAQLAQVKAITQQVLVLDESYKQGNAHVYMAVMESLLPASLGGKPDLARQHFERAQQLAPNNLMINVLYAKHYARMIFDRDLHDQLLKSTLQAQTSAPGLTLINTLAQQEALQLLNSADDYF